MYMYVTLFQTVPIRYLNIIDSNSMVDGSHIFQNDLDAMVTSINCDFDFLPDHELVIIRYCKQMMSAGQIVGEYVNVASICFVVKRQARCGFKLYHWRYQSSFISAQGIKFYPSIISFIVS